MRYLKDLPCKARIISMLRSIKQILRDSYFYIFNKLKFNNLKAVFKFFLIGGKSLPRVGIQIKNPALQEERDKNPQGVAGLKILKIY